VKVGYLGPGRERLKVTRSRIKPAPAPVVTAGADEAYVPSDEDRKLLADHTAEVRKRQVSSSENFDKSVLTLSSGGLAVSLGFLKDFVPIGQASWPWALYISWIALTLATVVTMLSFLASMKAQEFQQEVALRYYLRKEDPNERPNKWDSLVIWMNRLSGASFIAGVSLTTLFVAINLQRAHDMKNSRPGLTQDALTPPTIQQASGATDQRRGLPSPGIVPSAPGRPAPASAPVPAPAPPAQNAVIRK